MENPMFKFGKKHILFAIGILVTINLALIPGLLLSKIVSTDSSRNGGLQKIVDPDAYQAVFLDNDQIYFGRLKNAEPDSDSISEYLVLSDVYYVKVYDDGVGKLVKLGQIEPHRPTNEMIINQDHVLFWENLSPDSPVVQTIRGSVK